MHETGKLIGISEERCFGRIGGSSNSKEAQRKSAKPERAQLPGPQHFDVDNRIAIYVAGSFRDTDFQVTHIDVQQRQFSKTRSLNAHMSFSCRRAG